MFIENLLGVRCWALVENQTFTWRTQLRSQSSSFHSGCDGRSPGCHGNPQEGPQPDHFDWWREAGGQERKAGNQLCKTPEAGLQMILVGNFSDLREPVKAFEQGSTML